jgi:hypothetical protein
VDNNDDQQINVVKGTVHNKAVFPDIVVFKTVLKKDKAYNLIIIERLKRLTNKGQA